MNKIMLMVPAEQTADLRGGLITELGIASTTIADLAESPSEHSRETYEPWRMIHEQACGALDEIAWTTPTPTAPIQVDLAAHRSICLRALEGQMRSYTERMDEMQADEQRVATERVQGLHALICAARVQAAER